MWNRNTHFFDKLCMLAKLSWRPSFQAIGSLFFRRHGKHEQQPVFCSPSSTIISCSILFWTWFVFRQQNTLVKHNAHLPRSFCTASVADWAVWVACCSMAVISSIIFSSTWCCFRLQQFIRFQHDCFASITVAFSFSFKMDVAISVAFLSSAAFFVRLVQHDDDFFKRRHGKHKADA